jgi:hypothetical protein
LRERTNGEALLVRTSPRRAWRRAILVAGRAISRRLSRMGAKYLPTTKDLKASRRFQEKQNPLPFLKKPSGAKHPKKSKKS